jgi:asparaginyl-tRNA synthetase
MLNEKMVAVLKVRAKVLQAARCWLDQNGYLEIQGPTLVPAVGDWPGHFEVKYFDKKAYLTQGLQPYADAFVASLGGVYTVAPSFRNEKMKTNRHLAEYWRIEVAQQVSFDRLIAVQEELLTHICCSLVAEAENELKYLGRSTEDLLRVKPPFCILTYEEAIETLQKYGKEICWGQEITWDLETYLSLRFDEPFFITEFPIGIHTLFYKSHPKEIGSTFTADLIAPEGYGEIGSGGQMEDEKNALARKMAEEKIEARDRRWYMSLRHPEVTPNSGFIIGFERLVQWIGKLEHINQATAFPRWADCIYP